MNPKLMVVGSLNYDITLYVDRFAPPKTVVRRLTRYLGGSGGNSAVAAARILGDKAVVFFGAVGNDSIGKKHIDALRREGIITDIIRIIDGIESGQAFVAVDRNGNTAIYSYYGANTKLTPEEINEKVLTHLEAVQYVLITNPPLPTALELVSKARDLGKTIIWDPGAQSKYGLDVLKPVLEKVDYLAPNEGELLTMTRAKNLLEAIKHVQEVNQHLKVLIKRGEKGSLLMDPLSNTTVYINAVPPEALGYKTTSTVGCGDAYVGVFTAFLILGYSEVDAMKLATCAATLNAAYEGPRGVPPKQALLKWFEACKVLIQVKEEKVQ